VAVALAGVLFAQAFLRLRRRGRDDHAPWTRAALFGAGLALAALPLLSPLDEIGEEYLLSGHMLQHVLIGDAAAAFLVVALRGPLLFFLLPPPLLRRLARLGALRAALRFLLRPQVSFAVWAHSLALWHVPAAYGLALENAVVHDLEHLSFVVGGLLAWTQLVDPARRGVLSRPGRFAFALGMLVVGGALSNVLVAAAGPIYPAYAAQSERLLGLSPETDQDFAGLVMMAEQFLVLGAYFAFLLRAHFRAPVAVTRGRHPLAL
jgi:cytochrome c oxidase assembly factor CtaG